MKQHKPPTLPTAEEMLAYRREKFAVKVEQTPLSLSEGQGCFSLRVTQNGYQWESIGLLPEEARAVITELEKYLSALEGK